MPRLRRTRPPAQPTITLADLRIPARLDLLAGWSPRESDRPWQSYGSFLDCYRQVRDAFRVRHADSKDNSFAERLHQRMLADPKADVEEVGADLYANPFGEIASPDEDEDPPAV
jgi:hypothetical protein